MDISDLRKQIDEVDDALIRLFSQRMDIAADIARYKYEHGLPVFVPSREREVLSSISKKVDPKLEQYTHALYLMLFELSRCYQQNRTALGSSESEKTHGITSDPNSLQITMILPNEEDTLFKVIAKQYLYGIKIISLETMLLASNNAKFMIKVDSSVMPDGLSMFLHELEAMSDSFNISVSSSEVTP